MLHYAAINGSYKTCQILLQFGCNINIKDKHNQTPFKLAPLDSDIRELLLHQNLF